jgi:ribosomal protein L29
MSASLYDHDFYAWANEQAALLRSGKLSAADIENIAEEIESMGKAERRELVSRLTVLLQHLLKWQFQPERRGASWEGTIRVQRRDIADHLDDNPSLKSKLPETISRAYGNAAILAPGETELSKTTFPQTCPWSFGQIMDEGFWPE